MTNARNYVQLPEGLLTTALVGSGWEKEREYGNWDDRVSLTKISNISLWERVSWHRTWSFFSGFINRILLYLSVTSVHVKKLKHKTYLVVSIKFFKSFIRRNDLQIDKDKINFIINIDVQETIIYIFKT